MNKQLWELIADLTDRGWEVVFRPAKHISPVIKIVATERDADGMALKSLAITVSRKELHLSRIDLLALALDRMNHQIEKESMPYFVRPEATA